MSQFMGGYIIRSTNIARIEKILANAKNELKAAAMSEYHRMLSDEVCEIIDDITLGVTQRPGVPLLNVAVDRVNARIGKAEMTGSETEYDLRAWVSIIPDKKETYLILNASNHLLEEAFAKCKDIVSYKLTEEDLEGPDKSERVAKWEELCARCGGAPSMLSAVLTNKMTVDTSLLSFPSPMDRARSRSWRSLASRYLNQYACGSEIKSGELMPLMDKALTKLCTEDAMKELQDMTTQLASKLIAVTVELVTTDPTRPAPTGTMQCQDSEAGESSGESDIGGELNR